MGQEREVSHEPVMAEEVIEIFRPINEGVIVDATFGGGGHSRRLLEELEPAVRVLAVDKDPVAARRAQALDDRLRFVRGDFRDLDALLDAEGLTRVAGALFDLGISSPQLEDADRGFSYRHPGPLDMRMDPESALTAEEIVNHWTEERLAEVIARYGEERHARRIASAVVAARPVEDTARLAEVVREAIPAAARRRGGHPARRTFQALRIAVNSELEALDAGLEAAIERLRPAGRVAVLSYHSLEDRIVKRRFAAGAAGCVCPPDLPVCVCGRSPELRLLTRRALRPREEEVRRNPRSRSARLRAAEKVTDQERIEEPAA